MIAYTVAFIWLLACTGTSIYILGLMSELDVHAWVIHYTFALGVEMLIVQLIKALIKYRILKPYEQKTGGSTIEFLRQT